jgi:hypothetical protein
VRQTRCALLAIALLASACRFERRPDLPGEGAGERASAAAQPGAMTLEDSVRAVASALDDALAVGDVARVALLSVPGATLIDQEEAVHWTLGDPETPLPQALAGRGGRFDWRLRTSRFVELGGAALLVNEYEATVVGSGVSWRAAETLIMVRTPEGWRLRHLHRSRGPEGGEI